MKIRQCTEQTYHDVAIRETLQLAWDIYDAQSALAIAHLLGETTIIRKTSHFVDTGLPITHEYDFNSVREFVLFANFCNWRISVCGAIERLFDLFPIATATHGFNREKVRAEDVQIAESVSKAEPYTFNEAFNPPIPALRLGRMGLLAYSAWMRLDKREKAKSFTGEMSSECVRAQVMKQHCLETVDRTFVLWNEPGESDDDTIDFCEVLTGGPFPAGWGIKVDMNA